MSKPVLVPLIGEVIFRRNPNARRLTITIKPQKRVLVTYPGFVSYSAAYRFVQSKSDWINSKLQLQPAAAILDNTTRYKTREHLLVLHPEARANIAVRVAGQTITVRYPGSMHSSEEPIQQAARKGIDLAFRIEAHRYLPERLRELAQLHGFTYNRLSIKRTVSRWGSCSAAGNINLSIYLMKLPSHLIDYIMLHELAHLRYRNHKKDFWQLLDSLVNGKAHQLARELKHYRTGV